jgi:hypothetical protein
MHELTKKMMTKILCGKVKLRAIEDVYDIDKIIQEWLKEKAIETIKSYGVGGNIVGKPDITEILGIKEKTLEEKFHECILEKPNNLCNDLAKIATDHFNNS